MKLADKNSIMEHAKIWHDKPVHMSAASQILAHLVEQPLYNLQHISFSSIRRITSSELNDYDLMSIAMSIALFSGLLDIKHELIFDDDQIDIDVDDIKLAETSGYLVHPVTGREVKDYKSHIFIYFECSRMLYEMKESGPHESGSVETLI
ncbi:hypothetical protein [Aeromonas molluscorum]|uniref:Uncharacterized protein n=1 Tax=Aeromonas molluscorum 848 TaxID=1268236 RepID=R1F9Y0_9GAMM|nr:hypothetical protein [Aeromonas molluscorum]EOD56523.1 hypothetical protein G113_03449 [Aeromonas molluscorum 848]